MGPYVTPLQACGEAGRHCHSCPISGRLQTQSRGTGQRSRWDEPPSRDKEVRLGGGSAWAEGHTSELESVLCSGTLSCDRPPSGAGRGRHCSSRPAESVCNTSHFRILRSTLREGSFLTEARREKCVEVGHCYRVSQLTQAPSLSEAACHQRRAVKGPVTASDYGGNPDKCLGKCSLITPENTGRVREPGTVIVPVGGRCQPCPGGFASRAQLTHTESRGTLWNLIHGLAVACFSSHRTVFGHDRTSILLRCTCIIS